MSRRPQDKYFIDFNNISLGNAGGNNCQSVIVSANYHNGDASTARSCGGKCNLYVGVAATGATGVIVEANNVGGCGKLHTQNCTMAIGPNVSHADRFRLGMNTGWTV